MIVVVIIGYSCIFTVRQTEQVLVVRLGEPVRVVTDPGLHFKAPFVDSVISIDKRILDLENPAQEIIAFDQRRFHDALIYGGTMPVSYARRLFDLNGR